MNDTPAEPHAPIDQRPAHACVTCPAPKTNAWWPAHPGYLTCDDCYAKLRDTLKEIEVRYRLLDATPGANTEAGSRGAPGFGSKPSASPHVITMRDWRSKSCEVSFDAVHYVFDGSYDDILEPGQHGPRRGGYVERREVWLGKDGRGHTEQEKPPRSIPASLASLAALIAEERDMAEPASRAVPDLIRWLDNQLDWITRNDLVTDMWDDLRSLAAQLRPVTGEPGRRSIGRCPNVLDDGDGTRVCSARLYAPLKGDEIRCGSCDRAWPREEWLRLGALLQEAS